MGVVERGPGPLDGLRVLDFTRVLSGPHCTRMLADMGAHVIKLEPPDGDLTRVSFPRVGSIATYFTQQNCGKQCISLDLRKPEAIQLLLQLVDKVDIVVENFRPDVMDRLGLGWDVLHARNPRLIFATITGYGPTGSWANRRAYAPVIGAEMGATAIQAGAFQADVRSDALSHADVYTGLECLSGILAALYQRERTGRGQRVDVSMAESMLSVNEHVHWWLQRDLDGMVDDDFVPSFRTEDYPVVTVCGHRVIISGHPANKGTFENYCAMIGRPELEAEPRFATVNLRRQNLAELNAMIGAWAAGFDSVDVLLDAVDQAGFAVGVVRTVAEAAMLPWTVERGAIIAVDNRSGGTVRIPNSPIRFSDADAGIRGQPRFRGEDNREVLRDMLGLDDARLNELEASGVLSSRLPKTR
jgi:CoA:oxalate CoA-transferase